MYLSGMDLGLVMPGLVVSDQVEYCQVLAKNGDGLFWSVVVLGPVWSSLSSVLFKLVRPSLDWSVSKQVWGRSVLVNQSWRNL